MKLSFNFKEQLLIGITLVVLITVIFGIFVFKPQYDRFSEARSNQEKELQDQARKKNDLIALKADKKNAALTEAQSLSLSKRMPEEADLPSILVELDNLGRETNIKVLDISPAQITPATGYSVLPVELKVAGTYFNLADFTYKLVKLPREYTLSDVSVETSEQGYPLLEATVKANAYVYTPSALPESSTSKTGAK